MILNIAQNASLSNELFQWTEEVKNRIVLCENKYMANISYYPLVEGQNLILKGEKLPSKFTKKTAIVSMVFGVGVYYELLVKSIPMKRYEQISFANITDTNYTKIISEIDCSKIGKCETDNSIPKM